MRLKHTQFMKYSNLLAQAFTKARKIVLYTVSGILLIGLANGIVSLAIGIVEGGADTSFLIGAIDSVLGLLLNFVFILSVFVITLAGFYLILGLGEDESRTKARKIILYAVAGILIIGLANGITDLAIGIATTGGDTTFLINAIDYVLNLMLGFVFILSVVVITIAGFYLILGMGEDESRTKARKIILYTVAGIIIMGLANGIVNLAIGIVLGGADTSFLTGAIQYVLTVLLGFVFIISVVVVTIAGFYLILGLGSDESRTKARKIILYCIVGIIIIGAANGIVNFALGIVNGTGDGGFLYNAIEYILSVIVSYTAILAVATIVIAGFYLILGLGSDESRTTARKIITYTIAGIIIIGLAYAIVNFAGGIVGDNYGDTGPIREAIRRILYIALSYVALLAVATIVIAGFYLILGLGSDESRTTARKIILYTIAGVIIMGLSVAIVNVGIGAVS